MRRADDERNGAPDNRQTAFPRQTGRVSRISKLSRNFFILVSISKPNSFFSLFLFFLFLQSFREYLTILNAIPNCSTSNANSRRMLKMLVAMEFGLKFSRFREMQRFEIRLIRPPSRASNFRHADAAGSV